MGHYSIDYAAVAAVPGLPSVDGKMHGCADDIYDESQQMVAQPGNADDPYATGQLKASGFVDGNDSEYRIGYGTDHAVYLEFGTTEMDAEPFLTPAATRQRGTL